MISRSLVPLLLTFALLIGSVACTQQSQPTPPAQQVQPTQQTGQGGKPASEPIKLGFLGIFSGRVAMLGETGFKGAKLAVQEINERGGITGRPVEISFRDTAGNRDEAVRIARDLVLKERVDFIVDGSSSAEAFAVSSAAKQLSKVDLVTASESASLTEPANLHDFVFRLARNTLHDGIAAGLFASKLPYVRWYTIGPDYEYGRSSTEFFVRELKNQKPDIQIVGESWPKFFEPDYTPHIQKILDAQPDAVYSPLWGGDLVAFIQQAQSFGLFDKVKFVSPNIADSLVLKALGGNLPKGMYTGTRFLVGSPETEANKKFAEAYLQQFGEEPTNWAVQAYHGIYFLKAAIEKAGSTESREVAQALPGLKLANMPWGDLEIRPSDHQLINYEIGWGITDPSLPNKVKIEYTSDWTQILQREKEASAQAVKQ